MWQLTRILVISGFVASIGYLVNVGYVTASTAVDTFVTETYGSPALQAISPDAKDIQASYRRASQYSER